MGTGKSIQALVAVALAHSELATACSLVVCPATLVGHWVSEIEKYFPTSSIFHPLCLIGTKAERQTQWNNKADNVNIVITSYSVVRSDIDRLESVKWCYCILDEGHLMKNPKTGEPIE